MPIDYSQLFPLLLLALTAIVMLATEPLISLKKKHTLLPIVGLVSTLGVLALQGQIVHHSLGNWLLLDAPRQWMSMAILLSAAVSLTALSSQLQRLAFPSGEAYALLLLSTIGSLWMVQSTTTLSMFIGMELSAIPVYALVGMRRDSSRAKESLLKYLLTGALFSGVFLYGASLLYGSTGSLALNAPVLNGQDAIHTLGLGLLLAALLFKAGAFPFHAWVPDVYSGAALPITGFMATTVKVAAMTSIALVWTSAPATFVIKAMLLAAILSISFGAFVGIAQNEVRRIMAYSGVLNSGFLLLAMVNPDLNGLWFYLLAYVLGTLLVLGSFTALLAPNDHDDEVTQFRGIARRKPFLGGILTLGLVSLSGLPPTLGFLAKFSVLGGLFQAGHGVLAALALALAVLTLAFYYRLVRQIWESEIDTTVSSSDNLLPIVLGLLALILMVLSIFPSLISFG